MAGRLIRLALVLMRFAMLLGVLMRGILPINSPASDLAQAYVDLVTGNSAVARHYVCYFGDIYLTNPDLLPELDVVTMFHLCEFFFPNTAS